MYKLDSLILFYASAHFSQVAFQHFQELDEHISYVATKVCHLGDQLEGVNTPRQRAVEAQKLMKYFNEFLDGELKSDVFTNSEKVSTVRRMIANCSVNKNALIMNYNYYFPDFKSLSSQLQIIQYPEGYTCLQIVMKCLYSNFQLDCLAFLFMTLCMVWKC